MKHNILYSSYDGISGNLGQSQIIPYLLYLSKFYNVTVFSLEKKENLKSIFFVEENFRKNNIRWYKYNYNYRQKLINFIKILFLNIYLFFLELKNKYTIIHIRGFPSFFLILISLIKNKKIIFDIRGFWIQEKIDRFNWNKNSLLVKFLKKIENYFYNKSNCIITLTDDSKEILKKRYINKKIFKIYTCVDTNKFREKQFYNDNVLNLGYLGSIRYAYNFNKVLKFIEKLFLNYNNINFLIFSNDSKKIILNYLNQYNIPINRIEIKTFNHTKVSEDISLIDFGIFYLNKNKSIKASFPTKIAEFLSLNIPIICNEFNNEIKTLLSDNSVGLLYNFENSSNISKIYKEINQIYIKNKKHKYARTKSETIFSQNNAKDQYYKIYESLIENKN